MNKDVYLQIRIDKELKAAAQERALAEGVTLSSVIREYLEEYAGTDEFDSDEDFSISDSALGRIPEVE